MIQRLHKLENPTAFMSVRLSLLCLPACLHGLCMHVSLPFGQKYFSSHLINRHIHILYLVIFVNMLLDICIRYYCWNSFWIPVKEVLFFSITFISYPHNVVAWRAFDITNSCMNVYFCFSLNPLFRTGSFFIRGAFDLLKKLKDQISDLQRSVNILYVAVLARKEDVTQMLFSSKPSAKWHSLASTTVSRNKLIIILQKLVFLFLLSQHKNKYFQVCVNQ